MSDKKTEKESKGSMVPVEYAEIVGKVLVQPRVSEKASRLSNQGKYVFLVSRSANKVSVKAAVEKAYKVKVTQVNITNTEGKKRTYGRVSGKMSDFKKAIVTLKEGDKIEGVTETI